MTDKTEVEAELAALRERVGVLERAAKPPTPPDLKDFQRFDPTARMSMPADVIRAMTAAVPNDLVRAIAADRYSTAPVSQVSQPEPTGKPVNKTGWRDTPLEPPPGIALADRLMDLADARDRADLIAGEARRRR
jgi:hypothetical protein